MASKGSLQHTQQRQSSHEIVMRSSTTSAPENFMESLKKDGETKPIIGESTGAYDLGELDQAFFLFLEGQDHASAQDQRQSSEGSGDTLNIFPSQPIHVEPSTKVWKLEGKEELHVETSTKRTVDFVSPTSSGSKKQPETSMELAQPRHVPASLSQPVKDAKYEGQKTKDPKTLRRLAQNREAARRSRIRKKAYVQQLESSRIKLAQLEHELQRTRAQGLLFSGGITGEQGLPAGVGGLSSDAVVFDTEYGRWLDENHRLMCNLRAAVQEHWPEHELRMFVDNCVAHYDQMMNLKSMMVKSDVFHIVSGMWKTPAERCFMWMGGFRPSELIKIILNQIGPLMEQQILLGICSLQQSTQEEEEALTQGLEALRQSLCDTITSSEALSCPSSIANYMGQMAIAMNKLSTLEAFVRQADGLRQQTLHRIHQILPTVQAARCCLAIAEYFHRLQVLSSLWLSRPRQE